MAAVVLITFGTFIFIRRRKKGKNNEKQGLFHSNKSKPTKKPEPPKKPELPKKPAAKTEGINPRIIICPECIAESRQTELENQDDSDEIINSFSSVMVFNNWIPYTAHILSKHPESSRVGWAISCIRDEITRLNRENKEIPKSIQTIIDLIKSHGKTATNEDYGTQYIELGKKGMISELEQREKPTKKIEIIDDWEARLGDITKLGKDEEIPTQKSVTEPDINEEKLKKIEALSGNLQDLLEDLRKKK